MTPAQQDQVVDECFQCKLCYVNCPYIPGQHEWELDFPRLMLRADQASDANTSARHGRPSPTPHSVAPTWSARSAAPLRRWPTRSIGTPGSAVRKVIEKTVGVASERVLPPYAVSASRRGSRSAAARSSPAPEQGTVALFPTCLVEYQNLGVGQDPVKVYERNGIECTLPDGMRCCGAPWLHQGDVDGFRKHGTKNVEVLAAAVRDAEGAVTTFASWCPSRRAATSSRRTTSTTSAGTTPSSSRRRRMDVAEYLWVVCTRARAPSSTPTSRARSLRPRPITRHVTCGAEHRPQEPRPAQAHRHQAHARRRVLRHRRHLGAARGERRDLPRGRARRWRRRSRKAASDVDRRRLHLANGGIVLETGQAPCTRSSSWRAPTASTRNRTRDRRAQMEQAARIAAHEDGA